MLGLNNPVPGPSRGMLFRAASIFAVVMRKKRSKESVASCMFANLFCLHEVNSDQCGNVKMTVNIPKGTEL